MLNFIHFLCGDTGSSTNQCQIRTWFQKTDKREEEWDGQSRRSCWLVEEVRCPFFTQKSFLSQKLTNTFGFWSEVSDLTARLQREEEKHLAATETLVQRVEKLTTENGELSASNATLEVDPTRQYPASRGHFQKTIPWKCGYNEDVKVWYLTLSILSGLSCARPFLTALSLQASVKKLEQQLADCESALVEESVVSQERKLQAERTQYQVAHIYSLITWQFLFTWLCFIPGCRASSWGW